MIYDEFLDRFAQKEEGRRKKEILRRAEHIRKRRKRKESLQFLKDRFKIAAGLLEEEKSGTLIMAKENFEAHLRRQMVDVRRHHPLGPPGHVHQPTAPNTEF